MKSHNARRFAVVAVLLGIMVSMVAVPALFAEEQESSRSDALIASLESALRDTRDPAARASIEEKIRVAYEDRAAELAGRAAQPDAAALQGKIDELRKQAAALEAEPKVFVPRTPAGDGFIVEGSQPPLPASRFDPSNNWVVYESADEWLVVYAGAQRVDESQGTIFVMTEGRSGFKVIGEYPSPRRVGALRVVGADGRMLQLKAEDGSEFAFDVSAKTYQ